MSLLTNCEFIIKLLIFTFTFFYTLDFIFKSEIHNTVGFSIICLIIILISILFYTFKIKNLK